MDTKVDIKEEPVWLEDSPPVPENGTSYSSKDFLQNVPSATENETTLSSKEYLQYVVKEEDTQEIEVEISSLREHIAVEQLPYIAADSHRKAKKRSLVEEEMMKIMMETDELNDFHFSESEDERSDSDSSESENGTSGIDIASTFGLMKPIFYTWTEVSDFDPGFPSIPVANISPGPCLPSHFNSNTTPIEYFNLFFDDKLFELIAEETKLQGERRKEQATSPTKKSRFARWNPPSICDIKALLGVIINMGLHPLPDIQEYFSTRWTDEINFFGDVFPRDEFLLLFWNLHFAHSDKYHALKKRQLIWNVEQKIRQKCQLFYSPGENICVTESTISSNGKVSFRVHNPSKPTKFGLKVFVLFDSDSGYLYTFEPYMGKQHSPDSDYLKTTQIMKDLCAKLIQDPNKPPSGHHIYTDRYYTSPLLAEALLKMKMVTTGTVLADRKGMPPQLQILEKMNKGDIVSFRSNEKLVLAWKNNMMVYILSTSHKGDKLKVTKVSSKSSYRPPKPKPDVVNDYIKNMGGADRNDLYIASYQFLSRTEKWYRKMFFWFLEVAIANSFLLYSMVQKKEKKSTMSHMKFRKCLVVSLVNERMQQQLIKTMRIPAAGPSDERLAGVPHFLEKSNRACRGCVVCKAKGKRKTTVFFCKTCTIKPFLHPDNCFELYHTQDKLS